MTDMTRGDAFAPLNEYGSEMARASLIWSPYDGSISECFGVPLVSEAFRAGAEPVTAARARHVWDEFRDKAGDYTYAYEDYESPDCYVIDLGDDGQYPRTVACPSMRILVVFLSKDSSEWVACIRPNGWGRDKLLSVLSAISLEDLTSVEIPSPEQLGVCVRELALIPLLHGEALLDLRELVSRVSGEFFSRFADWIEAWRNADHTNPPIHKNAHDDARIERWLSQDAPEFAQGFAKHAGDVSRFRWRAMARVLSPRSPETPAQLADVLDRPDGRLMSNLPVFLHRAVLYTSEEYRIEPSSVIPLVTRGVEPLLAWLGIIGLSLLDDLSVPFEPEKGMTPGAWLNVIRGAYDPVKRKLPELDALFDPKGDFCKRANESVELWNDAHHGRVPDLKSHQVRAARGVQEELRTMLQTSMKCAETFRLIRVDRTEGEDRDTYEGVQCTPFGYLPVADRVWNGIDRGVFLRDCTSGCMTDLSDLLRIEECGDCQALEAYYPESFSKNGKPAAWKSFTTSHRPEQS